MKNPAETKDPLRTQHAGVLHGAAPGLWVKRPYVCLLGDAGDLRPEQSLPPPGIRQVGADIFLKK